MNVMPIFINFLAVDTLHLDNEKIEKYCQGLKKNSPGRVVSNGGGWQSEAPLVDAATRQQMEQRTNWGDLLKESKPPSVTTPHALPEGSSDE